MRVHITNALNNNNTECVINAKRLTVDVLVNQFL